MNEGNVWGYLFAFLGVVGLAGGIHIMMETDKATEELAMVAVSNSRALIARSVVKKRIWCSGSRPMKTE
jgi:hypothetical protein